MKNVGVGVIVALGAAVVFTVAAFAYAAFYDTPDFSEMRRVVTMPIKRASGELSTRRVGPLAPGWIPNSQISKFLQASVVASEDTSFFSHSGIDVYEMKEALKKDIKEGRFARGASTLTQQVLKNVYLGADKNLWRKMREIVLAPRLEKTLTKTEILTFYLNMAEWGPGIYGCGAASQYYFGVPPSDLSAKQAAFLTMLLPSPRRYHSYFRTRQLTAWANARVNKILSIMYRMGDLDETQYQLATNEMLWGTPALSDDAPGAPKDPGFVTETEDQVFDTEAPPAADPVAPPPAKKAKSATSPGAESTSESENLEPEVDTGVTMDSPAAVGSPAAGE